MKELGWGTGGGGGGETVGRGEGGDSQTTSDPLAPIWTSSGTSLSSRGQLHNAACKGTPQPSQA